MIITQLFYDCDLFAAWVKKCREAGACGPRALLCRCFALVACCRCVASRWHGLLRGWNCSSAVPLRPHHVLPWFGGLIVVVGIVLHCVGINVPIIPGIMPIQDYNGFKRMTGFCKTYVPKEILDELEPIKVGLVPVLLCCVSATVAVCVGGCHDCADRC